MKSSAMGWRTDNNFGYKQITHERQFVYLHVVCWSRIWLFLPAHYGSEHKESCRLFLVSHNGHAYRLSNIVLRAWTQTLSQYHVALRSGQRCRLFLVYYRPIYFWCHASIRHRKFKLYTRTALAYRQKIGQRTYELYTGRIHRIIRFCLTLEYQCCSTWRRLWRIQPTEEWWWPVQRW